MGAAAQRGQDVRRGDIVVFNAAPGSSWGPYAYVKRVTGLPGDHVACCTAAGDVTVNGEALHEPAGSSWSSAARRGPASLRP